MKHARKDYNRIQDLAEVVSFLRSLKKQNYTGMYAEDATPELQNSLNLAIELLEVRYGPLEVKPIPENEPVFLLRAKDLAAALTVRVWSEIAEALGAKWDIILTARNHADEMARWEPKQIPDMPEGAGEPI